MRAFYFSMLVLIASCSPKFKIQTDTPFPGDFEKYQSFKFFNPNNMPAANFAFEKQDKDVIFDAVGDELSVRGYKSRQDADLMVKIQGGIKSTVEIRNDGRFDPYGYGPYDYRYGRYGDFYNRPRDESKKEASIIIDIIDIDKDKIVWQGVGIGSLKKNEGLNEIQIREAIASIFTEYPYRAGADR